MAQVMNTHIFDLGFALDGLPETADLDHGLSGNIAWKEPGRGLRHDEFALPDNGGHVFRDRHAMHLALFCCRCGLGPDHQIEIELLEARLARFADPCACQHADANDPCGSLICGFVERYRQPVDLRLGEEPLPRALDSPVKAVGRIVVAPTPLDGEVEGFPKHFPQPIGADRRGLRSLQLSGSVVGLCLVGSRPALSNFGQELVHVRLCDLDHQPVGPMRRYKLFQHGALVRGIGLGELAGMFFKIAINQVADPRLFAQLIPLGERIISCIDFSSEFFGSDARGTDRPFGPATEGHAPLTTGMAVIDGKGPAPAAVDTDGKASELRVKDLIVPPLGWDGVFHKLLGEFLSLGHIRLLSPSMTRRFDDLSSSSWRLGWQGGGRWH